MSLLLSSDTLHGYGLDLVFSTAKDAGCDGVDLAMRKNFDARHENYVAKLSKQYGLPIVVVQTSSKVNAKELNQAIAICQATGASIIAINAPSFFDVKTYSFLTDNLHTYQEHYPDIHFSIINGDTTPMAYLPLPRYRFNNLADTIKTYKCMLGLDISLLDTDLIDNFLMVKMPTLTQHISVCYVSDRLKNNTHLIPGEGAYNIASILKNMKKSNYTNHFSVKLHLDPQVLIDNEKTLLSLQRTVNYINEHFK